MILGKFSDYNFESTPTGESCKEKEYQDMISKYSKLNSNELMEEFLKLTMNQKSKGGLSDSELDGIKNTLYPYLNNEQKAKLESIINMVKNVK